MDEDTQAACEAQQQQEEAAQWEVQMARHRAFRSDCDAFHARFEGDLQRIFSTAQAVNERKVDHVSDRIR